MPRRIDVRRILEEKLKKTSNNAIALNWGISKHSVQAVVEKATALGILPDGPVPDMEDDKLYKLFFSEKLDVDGIHEFVDFEYVHKELKERSDTSHLHMM